MDKNEEIYRWVAAWIKGELTPEDEAELACWLKQDPKNQEWFDTFTTRENLKGALSLYASFHTAKRWEELERYCRITNRRKIHPGYWRYVAAVVILFIIGGIGFLYFVPDTRKEMTLAAVGPKEFHQQAVLVLENGKELVLNGIKDTCLSLGQGERLWLNDQGRLAYHQDSLQQETPEEWHILRIPRGGEYTLVLEDGSRVWLNSASELRYPVRFTGKNRQVTLEGEAYFEVARNEARPFIVQSGKQRVEVLGTSFDVTAYEGEPGIYTTLLQGSVEVSGEKGKQLLKPGQQAIYTEKGIEVKEVNAALYCSWIQDRFVFVSEELEAVTRKLERWYDVSFFFAGESLKIKRFSGSIPKYSDLSKVLKMLELTTNIRFKKTDKTVVVEMIQ